MTRTGFASSHQDTVSGREEEQNQQQECESLYVTIQEAARRCGVSDKTIQRAIRAGDLPAQYPKKNRCEIAISDLERIRPGHVQTVKNHSLAEQGSEHIQAEMEQRVQQLEHLVAEVLDRTAIPKRPGRAKARERTAGSLPKQFVSLLAFARHHNVAQAKVQTHTDMGLLPAKRGEWINTDGTVVTLAFDAKGRYAFYQLYHGVPPFIECDLCPHGYQDSVSGHG